MKPAPRHQRRHIRALFTAWRRGHLTTDQLTLLLTSATPTHRLRHRWRLRLTIPPTTHLN